MSASLAVVAVQTIHVLLSVTGAPMHNTPCRNDAVRGVLRRTARRYRGGDRFTRFYVACKLRMDPVHAAVLALARAAPFGAVLDVGCGRGQLSVALLEAGLAECVVALDRDDAALGQLRRAASGLNLSTAMRDLVQDASGVHADTVLLIDVLYQLPQAVQLDLLRRVAGLARRMVVIRTTDPQAGWRSALSMGLERLGRGVWPTFGERAAPLPPQCLADVLTACGFTVAMAPCAQGTPLAGVLLVGRATSPPASSGRR